MDATKDIIGTHTKAFDGLKQSLESIQKMAKSDMDILNFYEEEDNNELKKNIGEMKQELVKIEEEQNEEDIAIEIQAGRKIESHESQKKEIYDQINQMTSSMKGFAFDIENRLDKAYKDGAQKKFGFSDADSARSLNDSTVSFTKQDMKDLDLNSQTSSNIQKIASSHKKTKAGSSALKPKMPKPPAKD